MKSFIEKYHKWIIYSLLALYPLDIIWLSTTYNHDLDWQLTFQKCIATVMLTHAIMLTYFRFTYKNNE